MTEEKIQGMLNKEYKNWTSQIGISLHIFPKYGYFPNYVYHMFSFQYGGWSNTAMVDFWQTAKFVFHYCIISLLEEVNLFFIASVAGMAYYYLGTSINKSSNTEWSSSEISIFWNICYSKWWRGKSNLCHSDGTMFCLLNIYILIQFNFVLNFEWNIFQCRNWRMLAKFPNSLLKI